MRNLLLTLTSVVGFALGSQGQTADITWTYLANTDTSGNVLNKDYGGSDKSYARSRQVLWGSTDGYFEWTVDQTNKVKMIGFKDLSEWDPHWDKINYGFYLKNDGNLYKHIDGTWYSLGTTYANNDVLKVERVGSKVYYTKNSVRLDSSNVDSTDVYVVSAALYHSSSHFTDVESSFTTEWIDINPTMESIELDGTGYGKITVSVEGGDSPYSYAWSHNGDTTNFTDSLAAGTYTVTITDNSSHVATKTFSVGYKVDWENLVRTSEKDDTLSNTGGSSWQITATTTNSIYPSQDGWVEYTILDNTKTKIIGFIEYPNASLNWSELDYAFYFHADDYILLEENSSEKERISYDIGDVIKLERIGSAIKWYWNGNLVRSVATDSTKHLIVDAHLHTSGGELINTRMSTNTVYPKANPVISDFGRYFGDETTDFATTIAGGTAPYSLVWTPGNYISDDLDNLATNSHTLSITDDRGLTVSYEMSAGYSVIWENFIACDTLSNTDTLDKSGGTTWACGANSINLLLPNEDGWVEYTVEDKTYLRVFGFKQDGNSTSSSSSVENGWYMHSNGFLYSKEGSSNNHQNSFDIGDVLRISREDGKIYYYKNGVSLRQQTADMTKTLVAHPVLYTSGATMGGLRTSFPVYQNSAGPDVTVCSGNSIQIGTDYAVDTLRYSWTPIDSLDCDTCAAPFANPSATTNYTVYVKLGNDTIDTDTVTVTVVTDPTASAGTDQTICIGETATLIPTGGTSYEWSNNTSNSGMSCLSCDTTIVTPLDTTEYYVDITDANGCTDRDTVIVNVEDPSDVAAHYDTICTGNNVVLTAPSGTYYHWTPTDSLSCDSCQSPTANPIVSQVYNVLVTNANGCHFSQDFHVIVGPVGSVTSGVSICTGDTTEIIAYGGTTYSWTPTDSIDCSSCDTVKVWPSETTTYTVTIEDADACDIDLDVTIAVLDSFTVDLGPDSVICPGNSLVLIPTVGLDANNTDPVYYSWSNSSSLSCATCVNPTAAPSQSTDYILTATNGLCSVSDTITVDVDSLLNSDFTMSVSNDTLTLTAINLETGDTADWEYSNAAGYSGTATGNSVTFVAPYEGVFSITMIITNSCGTVRLTKTQFIESEASCSN